MTTVTLQHSESCFWHGKLRMWWELFEFAKRYGWKPAGSLEPPGTEGTGPKWSGEYLLPLGQIVTASDARALGKALQFALRITSTLVVDSGRRDVVAFAKFCAKGKFVVMQHRSR